MKLCRSLMAVLDCYGFLIIPPVRKWIIKTIMTRDPSKMLMALWCLTWIARRCSYWKQYCSLGAGLGSPELYTYWAPMSSYYAIADSLNCLAGAIMGTAVLTALKKANLVAADLLIISQCHGGWKHILRKMMTILFTSKFTKHDANA